MNMMGFPRTAWWITESLVKIKTCTDNRSGIYFVKRTVKIYYPTILNNNRKSEDI